MWSSYLDKEVWLTSHSVLVLEMRWGDIENFPKCCVNLCVVILHQGVQVWALLVGVSICFKWEATKVEYCI